MYVCLYSYFFCLLLPNHLPPPLTSVPFWLFQFTGSSPACSTEKSEKNVHLCPDFYHMPQKEPGGYSSYFTLMLLSGSPPGLALKCHHQPEGLHWPRTKDLLFSAYWFPYGETADYSVLQTRLMKKMKGSYL